MSAYPSLFYGWARRNSRPTVYWSKSQTRKRLNGLLAVDALTGDEFVVLEPEAPSELIALYFYDLARSAHAQGYDTLTVILDNAPTHKDTMRYQLWLRLRANPDLQHFTVRFLDLPAYSPDFNLAEYVIHLLRLKLLHHLPMRTTLDQVYAKIEHYFTHGTSLLNAQQVKNTIRHILALTPRSLSLPQFVKANSVI